MAELEVQPKKSRSWWPWVLLALIALAVAIFIVSENNNAESDTGQADSTQSINTSNR